MIPETYDDVPDPSDPVPVQSSKRGKVPTARHTLTTAQAVANHEDLVHRLRIYVKANHGQFRD